MSFIPRADSDFLDFAVTFTQAAQSRAADLSIPADVVSALVTKKTAFATAYAASLTPEHSSIDTTVKNEKRAALEHDIRHIKKAYLDPVEGLPDSTWEAFGIKPPDHIRTPARIPSTLPVVTPRLLPPGVIEFIFHAAGKKWGKDPDAHGLELIWAVLDHPPASLAELIHSSFETASPITLSFDISMRGKILYYAARWENGTARKGPWTEVEFAVIP